LFAVKNGKIEEIFCKDDVFQGSVQAKQGLIEEAESLQRTCYVWKDGLVEADCPKQNVRANTRIVFEVRDGKVIVRDFKPSPSTQEGYELSVTLKSGQTISLERIGKGDSERILYDPGSGAIKMTGDSIWKALSHGVASISIIPNGYDWEEALHITVNVN
jgi:hypothetical protein